MCTAAAGEMSRWGVCLPVRVLDWLAFSLFAGSPAQVRQVFCGEEPFLSRRDSSETNKKAPLSWEPSFCPAFWPPQLAWVTVRHQSLPPPRMRELAASELADHGPSLPSSPPGWVQARPVQRFSSDNGPVDAKFSFHRSGGREGEVGKIVKEDSSLSGKAERRWRNGRGSEKWKTWFFFSFKGANFRGR